MKKTLIKHGRRIGVVLLSSLLGRDWFYSLIGILNKHVLGRSIRSVFLLYPANEKYTLEYSYAWYAELYKWRPGLAGFFIQQNRRGLTFAVSAVEKDFLDLENGYGLKSMFQKIERIRYLLGADQKTFAGILPSLLVSRGIMQPDESVERKTTVAAVLQAIERVKEFEQMAGDTPVIVLGGSGFIGSGLLEANRSNNFYPLDVGGKENFQDLANKFSGRPMIVLNLTKKGALSEYTPYLWPGVVVLNEVYPEPGKSEVAAIQERGASCYHIAGVKGRSWPGFPRGYQGGIPCCASFLPEKEGEGSFEVIVRKM